MTVRDDCMSKLTEECENHISIYVDSLILRDGTKFEDFNLDLYNNKEIGDSYKSGYITVTVMSKNEFELSYRDDLDNELDITFLGVDDNVNTIYGYYYESYDTLKDHTHSINDISVLQSVLDEKANVEHTQFNIKNKVA